MKNRIQLIVLFLVSAYTCLAELPDPWKTKEYSVIEIEGRFGVYIGIHPIILDSELKKKSPKTYLEAIEAFGPAFTSRLSSAGTWEWHFSDNTAYNALPKRSGPLTDKIILKELKSVQVQLHPTETIKPNQSEQATP